VADWRKIPESGTVLGIRALVFLSRVFGRRMASGFLYFVAGYFALVRSVARQGSRAYLAKVGLATGFLDVLRHLHTFARVSLDRLYFLTGKWKPFTFEQIGHDHLVAIAQSRRGAILIGAHIGSFEVMRCRAKEYDLPINVVVDFSNAARLNSVLRSLSSDATTRVISLADDAVGAMLTIRAAIERGELVAILGDRLPATSDRKSLASRVVKARFLGAEACFPAGPWLLAHSLRAPVYFVAGLYQPPNHYRLHFEPLATEVVLDRKARDAALARYVQAYADVLERFVRSAPRNWFNFYDFWSSRD
jgi:predicted LPLAT superfamily acyltransferase